MLLIIILLVVLPAIALAVGVWLGIGAPGLPKKPTSRRRLHTRPINPIAYGARPRRR